LEMSELMNSNNKDLGPDFVQDIPVLTAPKMTRTPSEEELAMAIAMSLGELEDDAAHAVVDFKQEGEEGEEIGESEGAGEVVIPQKEDSEDSTAILPIAIQDKNLQPPKNGVKTYQTLEELGLEVKHVLNDGNCEFEAIRDQLRQLGYAIDDHNLLRIMFGDTIKQMKDNPEQNPNFKEVLAALSTRDLTDIFFEGRWENDVADLFPQVAANMFRCAIHIYNPEGSFMREVRPEGMEGDIEDIARVIYNGHHYDSTRIKGSGKQTVIICRCGKCAEKFGYAGSMAADPNSRRSQFRSLSDVWDHMSKIQKASNVEVMEEMQVLDRVTGTFVTIDVGSILEVLSVKKTSILVQAEFLVRPLTISTQDYFKLEPYESELEREQKMQQTMEMMSMLLNVVGNSKQAQKKRKRAWSQLELNDRMRVNESFVLNGETVRRGEIFTIIMIKSNDLVLMKSDTKLIEITSSSRYFQYFEKVEHVNLDDVEKTVQAKAYIVEQAFLDFPKGTRLVVTQVIGGETTVFHEKLLEEPIVLSKGELARCKIESELIDFNASLNLRGRTAQISEYFEQTEMYRVQYADGSSKNFTHDELVDEISYTRKLEEEDEEDELEDKMVEKPKPDLVPGIYQLKLKGTWCSEDGDIFGVVRGTEYYPGDSATDIGFIHIDVEDQVTLRLKGEEKSGFYANLTIFWEDEEVWHHESNIQTNQVQDDRMMCDQIADEDARRALKDILQGANDEFRSFQQQKRLFSMMQFGRTTSPEDQSAEKTETALDEVNAQFASMPGFGLNSRQQIYFFTETILSFLYGDDSPIIKFARNPRLMLFLNITATLLGWPFAMELLHAEKQILHVRLWLLSDDEFEAWNDALNDEVNKYNDAATSNSSQSQNALLQYLLQNMMTA